MRLRPGSICRTCAELLTNAVMFFKVLLRRLPSRSSRRSCREKRAPRAQPPRQGSRPAPWRNQQRSSESYGRRQQHGGTWQRSDESYGRRRSYGSGEPYDSRQGRWDSSWGYGGESYDRHGYGGSSSSWGYSRSDSWWQQSAGRPSAPWRRESADPPARPYRRREDDEGEDRNVRPRGGLTGAASAVTDATAGSAPGPWGGAAVIQ